jgi:hypothetical protein
LKIPKDLQYTQFLEKDETEMSDNNGQEMNKSATGNPLHLYTN